MYAVDSRLGTDRWVNACMTVSGPSTSNARAKSGIGTTSPDHTVSDRPPTPGRRRTAMLPPAQDAAAATHNPSAPNGTDPPRPNATIPSPSSPSPTPMTWRRLGRSRNSVAANTTVKAAWICRTSEASPGGIPADIAL